MVNKIQNIGLPNLAQNKETVKNEAANGVFEDFYKAAINLIEDTNNLELEADQKSLEFAMGKTSNIEEVLIAQKKANILLQFTIQVRNKAVESYKEIMRMPL
ncbi:MAG TPA: flagellar hook-basal body complex protein FliE [Epulopiscium sp.]|nr:flagellar hook-basal body complex protein FliE [Candidatus Epulonipiscium sp.]